LSKNLSGREYASRDTLFPILNSISYFLLLLQPPFIQETFSLYWRLRREKDEVQEVVGHTSLLSFRIIHSQRSSMCNCAHACSSFAKPLSSSLLLLGSVACLLASSSIIIFFPSFPQRNPQRNPPRQEEKPPELTDRDGALQHRLESRNNRTRTDAITHCRDRSAAMAFPLPGDALWPPHPPPLTAVAALDRAWSG
jgi:hypothetical protein